MANNTSQSNSDKKIAFIKGYANLALEIVSGLTKEIDGLKATEKIVKLSVISKATNVMCELSTGGSGKSGLLAVVSKGCATLEEIGASVMANRTLSDEFKARLRKETEALASAKSACNKEFDPVAIAVDGQEDWNDANKAKVNEALGKIMGIRKNYILQLKDLFVKCAEVDTREAFLKLGKENETACNELVRKLASVNEELTIIGLDISKMIGGMTDAAGSFQKGLDVSGTKTAIVGTKMPI